MTSMKPCILPALAALLPFLCLSGAGWGDTLSYRGLASDEKTGRELYSERHLEQRREGRTVTLRTSFLDPEGNRAAERFLDFSLTPSLPGYRFEDFRSGWEEGAHEEGNGIRIYCRKGRGLVYPEGGP